MKNLYLMILFVAASAMLSGQMTLTWSPAINVAGGTVYGTSWPRIALTANDIPVVSWGNKNTKKLYVSRLNGAAFTTPVKVTPGNSEGFVADWAGPDIGAWGDSVFCAYKSSPETPGYNYIVRSTDGGMTFSDSIRADNFAPDRSRFPAVDVLPGGNPVISFMRFDSTWSAPEYEVMQSMDGGQTFQQPVPASNAAPGEVCDCCPADIRIYGNTWLLPFRNNDVNIRDSWTAISNNSGNSFDTIARMDTSNWNIAMCPSQAADAAMKGDSLISVWTTAASGAYKVWLSAMDTSSLILAIHQPIDTSVNATQRKARMVARGDTMGLVWEDNRTNDYDIYLAWNIGSIRGLSGIPELAVETQAGMQQNPDVIFRNGVFHIVFHDMGTNQVVYRSATITSPAGNTGDDLFQNAQIIPNPASDRMTIRFGGKWNESIAIRIQDLQGRIMSGQFVNPVGGSSEIELDIAGLPSSVYVVELASGNDVLRRKLVKQ